MIPEWMFMTIVVLTTAVVIYGIHCLYMLGMKSFEKTTSGGAKTFSMLFSRSDYLRFFTVFLIIISSSFLALLDKLDAGIVSILSGIAGYVLGSMKSDKKKKKLPDENSLASE